MKRYVRKLLRSAGIDVRRFVPGASPVAQLIAVIRQLGTDLILDVGANAGQFGQEMRSGGYAGQMVSFEPLFDAHSLLLGVSRRDSRWHIHKRCAVGAENAEIEINVAQNSVSSSVLPMLELHEAAAPGSAYRTKERVPLRTLDSVARGYVDEARSTFLKIDTQGYEWQVLDGAKTILPKVSGLIVEMSFAPLYAGQRLWGDLIDRLTDDGFLIWALQPEFVDPKRGRTLQMNGIFVREERMR